MSSGWGRVGGPRLSAPLLQQTAELQPNKLHYHHCHQQRIPLQQITAVHITSLTAQKRPHAPATLRSHVCAPLPGGYSVHAQAVEFFKKKEYSESKLLLYDPHFTPNSNASEARGAGGAGVSQQLVLVMSCAARRDKKTQTVEIMRTS